MVVSEKTKQEEYIIQWSQTAGSTDVVCLANVVFKKSAAKYILNKTYSPVRQVFLPFIVLPWVSSLSYIICMSMSSSALKSCKRMEKKKKR